MFCLWEITGGKNQFLVTLNIAVSVSWKPEFLPWNMACTRFWTWHSTSYLAVNTLASLGCLASLIMFLWRVKRLRKWFVNLKCCVKISHYNFFLIFSPFFLSFKLFAELPSKFNLNGIQHHRFKHVSVKIINHAIGVKVKNYPFVKEQVCLKAHTLVFTVLRSQA